MKCACSSRGAVRIAILAAGWIVAGASSASPQAIGDFEAQGDVGDVKPPGTARFDAARREYALTGAGANMWEQRDAFHYLWRRASGDLTLSTAVHFAEKEGNEHRKAGWIVREGLESDAPYADAIVHADGLVALQYRLAKGGPTLEIRSPFKAPAAVRLERTGDLFTLFAAGDDTRFQPVGSVLVPLKDPVYAGLGVCSHDSGRSATAVFSGVGFQNPGVVEAQKRVRESSLEVLSLASGQREAVYVTRDHIVFHAARLVIRPPEAAPSSQ